jgi:hypothetical protein
MRIPGFAHAILIFSVIFWPGLIVAAAAWIIGDITPAFGWILLVCAAWAIYNYVRTRSAVSRAVRAVRAPRRRRARR